MNLYRFANNTQKWSDPTGLNPLVIGAYEAFMYLLAVTGIYTIAVNNQEDGTVWSTSNDEESQSSSQSTTDISNCSKTETGCPPCSPPAGEKFNKGTRYDHDHGNCLGRTGSIVHWHYSVNHQKPYPDCTCFTQNHAYGGCGVAP